MKFFNNDTMELMSPETFVSYFSKSYFIGENRAVKGTSQSIRFTETQIEKILSNGIQKERDIYRILAWKI